ncbi:MAG TPA: MFS transporter [Pyrinomonadaceae bacterium]|jgi:MFS family permease|nr:MFS transporter [Pyrinomonadaceae bacterium]
MKQLTYAALLKQNKYLRWLLYGQTISELGNWFNVIAVLGLVRLISESSPDAAAIVLLLQTLPFAVLMPFAGTLVDRVSRRTVMLVADIARCLCALIFLLVHRPEDLWLVYVGVFLMSTFTAFFEAAKNATLPNLIGRESLLAGNALMFTPRFLWMAVGSALGGIAVRSFGYYIPFILNSLTFVFSTYSVWMIPEEKTRAQDLAAVTKENRAGFFADALEGLRYAVGNRLALTIILLNIFWAIGGGVSFIIAERLGGISFATREGWDPNSALGFLLSAAGLGLFIGMLLSRRVGTFVEDNKLTYHFIGWTVVVHGVLYSLGGLMPTLWLVGMMFMFSRMIIGAEYGLQETLLQRSIPDRIRGRVLTLDRGAEITVFSLSGLAGGYAMHYISPETLAVTAGIFAGSAGIIWFWREREARAMVDEMPVTEESAESAL